MITVYGLNVEGFHEWKSEKAKDNAMLRQRSQSCLFAEVATERPDFICLQETKCAELPLRVSEQFSEYKVYPIHGPKEAGVAILVRRRILEDVGVEPVIGSRLCDGNICAGRFLELRFPGLAIVSAYAYSDTSSAERNKTRLSYYRALADYMIENIKHPGIIVTDLNVALHRSDVFDEGQWSRGFANRRAGIYQNPFLTTASKQTIWIDSWRKKNGTTERRSTVWYQGNFGTEKGFGIDYQFVSPPLEGLVHDAKIRVPRLSDPNDLKSSWKNRSSDHALTIGHYEISLGPAREMALKSPPPAAPQGTKCTMHRISFKEVKVIICLVAA